MGFEAYRIYHHTVTILTSKASQDPQPIHCVGIGQTGPYSKFPPAQKVHPPAQRTALRLFDEDRTVVPE